MREILNGLNDNDLMVEIVREFTSVRDSSSVTSEKYWQNPNCNARQFKRNQRF